MDIFCKLFIVQIQINIVKYIAFPHMECHREYLATFFIKPNFLGQYLLYILMVKQELIIEEKGMESWSCMEHLRLSNISFQSNNPF